MCINKFFRICNIYNVPTSIILRNRINIIPFLSVFVEYILFTRTHGLQKNIYKTK
ncbi:unnamed protein product [Schistosoma mattheei]|uniref:Uncharacterized protein n=1 Tax=Schistosoma mattheei TaxID=31246 RepID=A0A183NTW9_9TREM|nr:unnamed protein product [Schistosoma mattheei]